MGRSYRLSGWLAAAALVGAFACEAEAKRFRFPSIRVAGVSVPSKVHVADRILVLNGVGVHETTIFDIDVYVGGLYLERRSKSASDILYSDQAKHLQLAFKRDVSRNKLLRKIQRGLRKRGRPIGELQPLLRGLANIHKGDVVTFTEYPDHTIELRHNGHLRARAHGREISRSLFASFLGSRPVNKKLRRRLLGR